MRSEAEMFELVVSKGKTEEEVRAILLNGSRANPEVAPDKFQDYDLLYLVKDIERFRADPTWIDYFGERLIMQLPEQNALFPRIMNGITYLMQFQDGNRIDLTVVEIAEFRKLKKLDSLTTILLDKDQLFENLPNSSAKDYFVQKPTEEEFQACLNEFWWVSTYVGKGLARNELTYAKAMQEGPVREMLLLALSWKVGLALDFQVNCGKEGKFLQQYLTSEEWQTLLATYSASALTDSWQALFTMCDFFTTITHRLEDSLNYTSDIQEEKIVAYLKLLQQMGK